MHTTRPPSRLSALRGDPRSSGQDQSITQPSQIPANPPGAGIDQYHEDGKGDACPLRAPLDD
ncbi:hypothetical protein E2C01_014920 [Portunus trituberculatus]|uniref:Uncharacterized protein n=1 Tax=Portunus trituberculatus TaxID=210409 RepID=A0A5B7DLB8_PORTR|nr:hypothetical protein [Portunus trituberculatus]